MLMKSFIANAVIAALAVSLWAPTIAHAEEVVKQTPDIWEWMTPTFTPLIKGADIVTYHAGAWDANGISSITIYVNGEQKRKCSYIFSYDNRECTYDLKASNYNPGTTLFINARAKDSPGNESWTTGLTMTVGESNAPAPTETPTTETPSTETPTTVAVNQGPDIWEWTPDSQTEINGTDVLTYSAGAWDANGVSSITIYVNGVYKRKCSYMFSYDKQECATYLKASGYTPGTSLFVNARAKDSKGIESWTTGLTITVGESGASTPTETPTTDATGSPDKWEWMTPGDRTEMSGTDVFTYHAGAWDANGVASIAIYVNGSLKRTCWYMFSYDTRECTADLKASSYTPGTSLFVNARAKDSKGNASWTSGMTVNVTGTATETPTETPSETPTPDTTGDVKVNPDVWEWTWNDARTLGQTETTRYTVGAWDSNGISSIAVYINGVQKRKCWYIWSYDGRECYVDLKGSDYAPGTTIFVNSVAKDPKGNATTSNGINIAIQ